MKKQMKKIVASVVAAVVAVMLVLPAGVALAKGTETLGNNSDGWYRVSSVKTKELTLFSINKTKAKTLNISTTIKATGANKGKYKVTRVAANAFKKSAATKVTLPNTIKKIDSKAFNGSKVKTLTIKSTKLTKKNVKGMFKGAKAKKIVVKVPKKKLKAYKKIFTKKNTGAKGTVVVKAI